MREAVLIAALAAAAGLIVRGVLEWSVGAAYIVGGLAVAGIALLVLVDGEG